MLSRNTSRGLFGWSSPVQPLTPVSEVSEPPESPSPYGESIESPVGGDVSDSEDDEIEQPPASVPFMRLFAYADFFDWVLMFVGAVAAAAHGLALVMYLHYFGKCIDLLSLSHNGSDNDRMFHESKKHVMYIIYIAAGVFVAGWIEVSCWIITGERQTAVIRSKYVQVLLNQDMSFFDTYGNNGDIVSQVFTDVFLIQSTLSEKVGNYIHNMATFFGGLVIGLINCWQIALLTLGTGPFIVAAGGISNIFLQRLAENIQEAYAEAASVADQAISSIRTLYAYTNETLAKYSFATSLQATLRYGILISLVQGLGLGFTYGIAICSCALQLWVGRFLVSNKHANGGEIVTSLFAIILSGLGLNQAATNFYSFELGRIAAYRLYEMISRSSSTVTQEGSTLDSVQGNIEFRNVYFSYLSRPEIPILNGFYLTVPAKKTVALVGKNGSGKSSIIPLMERFYDPNLGEVLLDGKNIKILNLQWLRSQIGLVTQEPALLNLSIKDNIAYGRSTTSEQTVEAAKFAHAHTFISSLEKGYDTQVGNAGVELTEEQKIKISIARAVISNPTILLLDEVTGGLDFDAERGVHEALNILMLGRSTIIIARRLNLIKNADFIAVMEEGQLVEMGTHDELLALDSLYAELLRCEETTKFPKSTSIRGSTNSTFQVDTSVLSDHGSQELSPPRLPKSPSLQRSHAVSVEFDLPESPKGNERLSSSTKSNDGFLVRLHMLPKVENHSTNDQASHDSDPESPISRLLTSDAENERSHSQNFSRPFGPFGDRSFKITEKESSPHVQPSVWRLVELSIPEWLYALLGSIGAAIFGSFNPLFAYTVALIVAAYYRINGQDIQSEVNRWSLAIMGMGIMTVVANFLQHFYFGIMGEKMTERVRRMMFSAILHNEVGWFDKEENSADNLSMRLANDATYVRAAFSNRLSIFMQDFSALTVALLVGMLLEWRVALVALATLPILSISAIAQKMWLTGFSKGIHEMHQKASTVLEDAVRNIYTVVAYCANNKVMDLYKSQLNSIYKRSIFHGIGIGFAFGLSQFFLFASNALLLYYIASSVQNNRINLVTALKEYMVFTFTTFALVEPFGLAPYILKRRQSLSSVFGIIDRKPQIEPDDTDALKPPTVYGTINLKKVNFSYPTHPELPVLKDFTLKVNGGQTVALVGVSGSGKSTILSLIERFYDPVSGHVLLDNRDLKSFNLRWLRSHIGFVQQEPVIFSTTIRENIIYARHNATEAEIKEAARIANAHQFISSLPHGYDTHIGMRGVDLTPGQKQRIAIARVILKNAPILLLDEASSAIESESSRVVQESLEMLIMGNRTTILVAHKTVSLKNVDNIVVINGGRIVEEGTHDALMQKKGFYVGLMQPHLGRGRRQHALCR